MLSALESAVGPGDTVEVYTSQKSHVVETLVAGKTHVQKWADTAAYNLPQRFARHSHKRAYRWMEREYAQRMRAPAGAPIWVGFDLARTVRHRKDGDTVLVLSVPRSELLLSMYEPWWQSVLEGWCADHDEHWGLHFHWPCRCTGRRRRETWKTIFDLAGSPTEWQGVLDRIEPGWVVKAYAPGEDAPAAIALPGG